MDHLNENRLATYIIDASLLQACMSTCSNNTQKAYSIYSSPKTHVLKSISKQWRDRDTIKREKDRNEKVPVLRMPTQ